jgi:hypothetical protein
MYSLQSHIWGGSAGVWSDLFELKTAGVRGAAPTNLVVGRWLESAMLHSRLASHKLLHLLQSEQRCLAVWL